LPRGIAATDARILRDTRWCLPRLARRGGQIVASGEFSSPGVGSAAANNMSSFVAEEPVDRSDVAAPEEPIDFIMGDNPAPVEKKNAVGERPHVIGMMCDHQYRVAFLLHKR
jgi:hypothetical protein